MMLSSRAMLRCYLGAGLLLMIAGWWFWAGSDPRTRWLAFNSLRLALGTAALSLPLGILLALFVERTDLPGRQAARLLLVAMLLVPLFLQAAAWDAGFGRLGWYTISADLDRPPLHSWLGAIWIHGMAAIPWVTLIVGIGLRLVEAELEDQALLDGAPLAVCLKLTLPRTASAVAVAGCWILVTTTGEMTVTDLLGVRTYAEEIYTGFALGGTLAEASRAVGPAVALVACLLALTLLAVVGLPSPDSWVSPRAVRVFSLVRWRWPAGLAIWSLLLVVIGLPIANLCYKAGATTSWTQGSAAHHWSVVRLIGVIVQTPVKYSRDFGWTLAISGAATVGCLLLAMPLAWFARRGGWRSLPGLLVAAAAMVVPGPLIGMWTIWCVDRIEVPLVFWLYDQTILAPVVCLVVRCLPVALLLTWIHVQAIPTCLIDQAILEGTNRWQMFWHLVVWPNREGFGVATSVTFAIGMGDLASTILVLPPGMTTVAFRVFDLVHYGVRYELAGLGLTSGLLFVTTGLVARKLMVWQRLRWRRDETYGPSTGRLGA
ncbi:MAG: hypothetical protein CMJ59_19670 [Planctomycetaceae bacterium]|nr:hypothetical protein [Planctomycetaceae bacterium]